MKSSIQSCIKTLLPAVLGLASVADADDKATPPMKRPNIVMIVADDLAPEWCNFLPEGHGKSLTPNLDELARTGVVLRNLHSTSPVCVPSRYTLLTGQYPSRATNHRFQSETRDNDGQTAVGFNTFVEDGDMNLARRLKSAGYATGAVGKNHVVEVSDWSRLKYRTPLDAPGVQETLAGNARANEAAFHQAGFDFARSIYYGNVDADGIHDLASHNQEWITSAAIDFIDQSRDKPFFLYMATTIPHGPHENARGIDADPRITPEGLRDIPATVQPSRESIRQRLAEAGVKGWNRENVLWLDDAIGAVIARLEKHGVKDDTIILFMSDHGVTSKGALYTRGGTNTVGLAWGKPVSAGTTCDTPMLLTDLMPTVLGWCNIAFDPHEFDGRNASAQLAGSGKPLRDYLYFELGYTRAILKGKLKYLAVRFPERAANMPLDERRQRLARQIKELKTRGRPIPTQDPMAPFSHLTLVPGGADAEQVAVKAHPDYFDADQLYDLSKDPNEQHNLIDDPAYAEQARTMRELLAAHLKRMPGRFGEFGSAGVSHAETAR